MHVILQLWILQLCFQLQNTQYFSIYLYSSLPAVYHTQCNTGTHGQALRVYSTGNLLNQNVFHTHDLIELAMYDIIYQRHCVEVTLKNDIHRDGRWDIYIPQLTQFAYSQFGSYIIIFSQHRAIRTKNTIVLPACYHLQWAPGQPLPHDDGR